MGVKYYIGRVYALLLDLLFPKRCVVCDEVIGFQEKRAICGTCLTGQELVRIKEPRCRKCGKQMDKEEDRKEYCGECSRTKHEFDAGMPLFLYNDSLRQSVYRFKYGKRMHYAEYYGEAMAEHLGDFIRSVRPQAIIPVPLHKKRFEKRGYNQAALLARVVGRKMNIPVLENCLVRSVNTRPMKLLNHEERQKNLKNAFKIIKNDVKLNVVLLIDDIYTTGATIDAIAHVLKAHGTKQVYFITLSAGSRR